MSTAPSYELSSREFVVQLLQSERIPVRVLRWEGDGGVLAMSHQQVGAAMALLATARCASAVHPHGLSVSVPPRAPGAVEAGTIRVVLTVRELKLQAPGDLRAVADEVQDAVEATLGMRGLSLESVEVQR